MTFSRKHSKDIPSRKPQIEKPLIIGARAFVRASKGGTPFVIYANPASEEKISTLSLPEQYKAFKDVFQKKNADILSEH